MQTDVNFEGFLHDNGFSNCESMRYEISGALENEISAAIAGRNSSLSMIPSIGFHGIPKPPSEPILAIDAGGTNLRVAAISIDRNGGGTTIDHLHKTSMPGTCGEISADEFHAAIAAEANRVLKKVPMVLRLGYCFSYECRPQPDGDAILEEWSKQIMAPEVVGQRIGAELAKRLIRKPAKISVINDTVATLLAGRAIATGEQQYSSHIGLILGTGTNVACEDNGIIYNAESGNFTAIGQSAFDIKFDATTTNPGAATLEKMTAGGFLGGVGLEMLRSAVATGLIQPTSSFEDIDTLSTMDLDRFAAGCDLRANPLEIAIAETSRETARKLARRVFERSASLTGIHLATFLRRIQRSDKPVLITVDGSTFHKTKCVSFREIVNRELAILAPTHTYELISVDDAPLMGAAIATLCTGFN